MYLTERRIDYRSKTDRFTLWVLGDVHIGNIGCHKKGFEQCIKEIDNDPRALVLLMGDLAECITPTDKRFDMHTVDPAFYPRLQDIAQAEYEYLETLLKPIASKVVGCLTGNHEEAIRTKHYLDLTRDLCRRLRIPYLGYVGAIALTFTRRTGTKIKGTRSGTRRFTIYAHHGRGSGRSEGGQINSLTKVSEGASADVYLMGHVHGFTNTIRNRMHFNFNANPPRIEDRPQAFAITGSFLKSYGEDTNTYSERAMYHPNALGCLKVHFTPYTKRSRKIDVGTFEWYDVPAINLERVVV